MKLFVAVWYAFSQRMLKGRPTHNVQQVSIHSCPQSRKKRVARIHFRSSRVFCDESRTFWWSTWLTLSLASTIGYADDLSFLPTSLFLELCVDEMKVCDNEKRDLDATCSPISQNDDFSPVPTFSRLPCSNGNTLNKTANLRK